MPAYSELIGRPGRAVGTLPRSIRRHRRPRRQTNLAFFSSVRILTAAGGAASCQLSAQNTVADLILLILSVVAALLPRRSVRTTDHSPAIDYAAILIPPLGYFAFSATADINIAIACDRRAVLRRFLLHGNCHTGGLRHIVSGRIVPAVAGICVGWLLIVTLWIAPHFLAYFNAFAGGPNNGWQALVDSNFRLGTGFSRTG